MARKKQSIFDRLGRWKWGLWIETSIQDLTEKSDYLDLEVEKRAYSSTVLDVEGIPEYESYAEAKAAGLSDYSIYRTGNVIKQVNIFVEDIEIQGGEDIKLSDVGVDVDITSSFRVLPTDAFDKRVTYESSDEEVFTVSDTGKLTATGAADDEAILTITTVEGKFDLNIPVIILTSQE